MFPGIIRFRYYYSNSNTIIHAPQHRLNGGGDPHPAATFSRHLGLASVCEKNRRRKWYIYTHTHTHVLYMRVRISIYRPRSSTTELNTRRT